MRNPNLQNQLSEINALLAIIPSDSAVQVHWGRYMCIVVAGFLENALQSVYKDYVSGINNANVVRYTSKHISRITNPNAGQFTQTAKAFSKTWQTDLHEFISRDGRREAIDTIMRNRNSIDHGGQAVISAGDVKRYLEKGIEVINFIENQCLGVSHSNP